MRRRLRADKEIQSPPAHFATIAESWDTTRNAAPQEEARHANCRQATPDVRCVGRLQDSARRSMRYPISGIVFALCFTATAQAAALIFLPPADEIQLALSAAPEHLRAGAAVYVFGKSGYQKVRNGMNGFTCLVNRDGNQGDDNDLNRPVGMPKEQPQSCRSCCALESFWRKERQLYKSSRTSMPGSATDAFRVRVRQASHTCSEAMCDTIPKQQRFRTRCSQLIT